MAIYDIDLDDLANVLIYKSHHGVRVRVLVDKKQIRGDRHSLVGELVAAGVDVETGRQRGSGIMHNKFTVVDGVEVELGSFNYTYHAANYNNENQIYLTIPNVVSAYEAYFGKLWREGRSLN